MHPRTGSEFIDQLRASAVDTWGRLQAGPKLLAAFPQACGAAPPQRVRPGFRATASKPRTWYRSSARAPGGARSCGTLQHLLAGCTHTHLVHCLQS